MRNSIAPSKARPDPQHRERLWFSRLLAPSRCKRLRTGEPIGQDLFDRVKAGIAEAITTLKPNHPYKAKYFVEDWDELSNGDRRRAGRCIADCARREGSPIGLIRRGRQSHRYFIRPVAQQRTPPTPSTSQNSQP
jgi:hypothetical protein